MDIEQLKVIWDSEHRAPSFTLNEAGLHTIVQRRIEEANRSAACRYRAEIAISLAVGIITLGLAASLASGRPLSIVPHWPRFQPSGWDTSGMFAASGVWFYFAAYLHRARRLLQRQGENFESTLRGDIDRSIARLEFQIKIARDIVAWGFIPVYAAIITSLGILFHLSIDPAQAGALKTSYLMVTLVALTAFSLDVVCRRRAIRKQYEPECQELDSLRRKLADAHR